MSDVEASARDASEGLDTHPIEVNLIEIGVILAGAFDPIDREAIKLAVVQVQDYLEEHLPSFRFALKLSRRPEIDSPVRAEPSQLLQQAVQERDAWHWDFAVVLTAAELRGNYSPYCFAALSRPLDAAAISLSLIDPIIADEDMDRHIRIEKIARRLSRLMLHALGHLSGLRQSANRDDLLYHPDDASELDAMHQLSDEDTERFRTALAENADLRLEERNGTHMSYPAFWVRAAWINSREILQAIRAARPWQFPQRLSRLTIASISTLSVLYMTAEAWDLAVTQSSLRITAFVIGTLAITTTYVVVRQQLLLRRSRRRTEQAVVTSASAFGIVFVGMLVTWCGLLVVGLFLSWLLFRPHLIESWAASSDLSAEKFHPLERLKMALFTSSFGLLIGALGASFESQNYFKHIIFVDEEI